MSYQRSQTPFLCKLTQMVLIVYSLVFWFAYGTVNWVSQASLLKFAEVSVSPRKSAAKGKHSGVSWAGCPVFHASAACVLPPPASCCVRTQVALLFRTTVCSVHGNHGHSQVLSVVLTFHQHQSLGLGSGLWLCKTTGKSWREGDVESELFLQLLDFKLFQDKLKNKKQKHSSVPFPGLFFWFKVEARIFVQVLKSKHRKHRSSDDALAGEHPHLGIKLSCFRWSQSVHGPAPRWRENSVTSPLVSWCSPGWPQL